MEQTKLKQIKTIAPYLFMNDLGEESLGSFDIDAGWALLVMNLVSNIDRVIKRANARTPDYFDPEIIYFEEIKEKNGILCVHMSVSDPLFDACIDFAEDMSSCICEKTGCVGGLHVKNGMLKTLSPKAARELGYEKYFTGT